MIITSSIWRNLLRGHAVLYSPNENDTFCKSSFMLSNGLQHALKSVIFRFCSGVRAVYVLHLQILSHLLFANSFSIGPRNTRLTVESIIYSLFSLLVFLHFIPLLLPPVRFLY